MTEEERIFSGRLFASEVPELVEKKLRAHRLSQDYSSLYEEDTAERERILHALLESVGEGTFMLGPIRFHYGCHTRIGRHCVMNFNFTVQDDARVTIGDHCNFGPNVTIVTPMHPMLSDERRGIVCSDGISRFLCYAKPVSMGKCSRLSWGDHWRQLRHRRRQRGHAGHSRQLLCGRRPRARHTRNHRGRRHRQQVPRPSLSGTEFKGAVSLGMDDILRKNRPQIT